MVDSLVAIFEKIGEFRSAIASSFPETLSYWCVNGTMTHMEFKLLAVPVSLRIIWDSEAGWFCEVYGTKYLEQDTPLMALHTAAGAALSCMAANDIETDLALLMLTETET